jgi:hypothetical protein
VCCSAVQSRCTQHAGTAGRFRIAGIKNETPWTMGRDMRTGVQTAPRRTVGRPRARPAAGRVALRGGPAQTLAPFPVPGRRSLFALLRVACHCWGLTCCCLRESPGGFPRAVAECSGHPLVDVCGLLCAGFLQCGSFVEVCEWTVSCQWGGTGWLVLVRGCGVCRTVSGGLRSGGALVDILLDVVPLLPRSSLPSSHLARPSPHTLLASVFTPCSPASSHRARLRLHTLLARIFTPCSPASSHLARPRLDTVLARVCTSCLPSSSHLARPPLDTLIIRVLTPCSPAS